MPSRTDTRSVTIAAPAADVFAFVAEPVNLPAWAVGFCRAIRPDGDDGVWIVSTAHGEVPIRYVVRPEAGTVDFHFEPAPGVQTTAYSRVVPNGDGCDYVFTQLQPGGMSDATFEEQTHALEAELEVLRGLMHARAACPA
jgi:hypothetical protein